jgi:hypothetical protein
MTSLMISPSTVLLGAAQRLLRRARLVALLLQPTLCNRYSAARPLPARCRKSVVRLWTLN